MWLGGPDGEWLAEVELPLGWWDRTVGLLGRSSVGGAMVIENCRSVHTFGMWVAIDVLACMPDPGPGVEELSIGDPLGLTILWTGTVVPGRVVLPRPGATVMVEVAAGSADRWGIGVGDRLTVWG